ncbi:Nonribosomal peptide synthetase 13 [Penicillium subrubescens]|uniref:Nonribosomal peptide synthetase 13 n=1 Tax=Penicillium subrubescens TaxID=1316194 RepID=A0A1Q5UGM1_9EURO|nr:Nonribosomal peptide synthetase 13 [Penicillium subrubescens]
MTVDQIVSFSGCNRLAHDDHAKLTRWNSVVPPTVKQCAHSLFQQRSILQPNDTSIDAWDGRLSYGALDALSDDLADNLSARYNLAGQFIPICMFKSKWVLVAMLGALKAGAAFVLLDPSHPSDRLRQICRDVTAPLIMVSTLSQFMISTLGIKAVIVDEELGSLSTDVRSKDELHSPTVFDPSSAMFVVFTSGSTGKPKGAIISHESFSTSAMSALEPMRMQQQSRVLQFASFAFDASVLEHMFTVIAGGCVCIPSENARQNQLSKSVNDLRVNWACLTPSVARLITPDTVPGLRHLILCGEAITSSDIDRWPAHVQMIGIYGPAECSILATIQTDLRSAELPTDLGYAPAATCWVVDPEDINQLVPIGDEGELIIEGAIVGSGYIQNQEQSAAAFINAPTWLRDFRCDTTEGRPHRLYKTGDLVRQEQNGSLEFLSRKDTQVKINGQRVELGEIEHQIRCILPQGTQEAIAEVFKFHESVILVAFLQRTELKGAEKTDRLFLDSTQNHIDQAQALHSQLELVLPSFMVPRYFLPISYVPKTHTDKINRRLLQEQAKMITPQHLRSYCIIQSKSTSESAEDERPLTAQERKLREIWGQLLRIPLIDIKRDDSWIGLGGNSILTMKMISLAEDEDIFLSVQDVYRLQTLEAISATVTADNQLHAATIIHPFALVDQGPNSRTRGLIRDISRQYQSVCSSFTIEDIYPCYPTQAYWISESVSQAGNYTVEISATLSPDTDEKRLAEAWHLVAAGNPSLRTQIVEVSGDFFQVVMKEASTLHVLEASRFEVSHGDNIWGLVKPLVWAEKIGVSLRIWIHHAIFDGFTLSLLMQQLTKAYQEGQAAVTQRAYSNFVKWAVSISPEVESFWTQTFRGFHGQIYPALPSETYRPLPTGHIDGGIIRCYNDSQLATKIRLSLTLTLARMMNDFDVVFSEIVWRREAPIVGIAETMGPTTARVPVRVALAPLMSLRDTLERLQSQILQSTPFQCAEMCQIATFSSSTASGCRAQTTLMIQPTYDEAISPPFKQWTYQFHESVMRAPWALTVICEVSSDLVQISAKYDPNILEPQQALRLMTTFEEIFDLIQQQPGLRVNEVTNPSDIL